MTIDAVPTEREKEGEGERKRVISTAECQYLTFVIDLRHLPESWGGSLATDSQRYPAHPGEHLHRQREREEMRKDCSVDCYQL